MRKKYTFLLMLPLMLVVATAGTSDTNSNAAPLGSTGAPSESNCAKSGCHVGSEVNAGLAELNLGISPSAENYLPSQVYDLSVSLAQSGVERFGFQLLALNSQHENVGEFIITDSLRTQIQQGIGSYQGRTYVTYKYAGTNPFSAGLGKWDFKWKAPALYEGDVKFYLAAVAANNDDADFGDTVYLKQFLLKSAVSSLDNIDKKVLDISIAPNPASDFLEIVYESEMSKSVVFMLTDLHGKVLKTKECNESGNARQFVRMDISDLPRGLYILRANYGQKDIVQKVIIE
jgi:hypothetical protein